MAISIRVCVDGAGSVNSAYMSAVGAKGIPTAFVINKHGQIVWSGHPMSPEFEERVQAVATGTLFKLIQHMASCDNKFILLFFSLLDAEVIELPKSVVPKSREELSALKISGLKALLDEHNIRYHMCVEKGDFVQLILDRIVNA